MYLSWLFYKTQLEVSPEQSRINGRKSKGPITQRGKAIVAQNARKHGLLSSKPPVLASEDLETFDGIMQSLVDKYEPSDAIGWHLVQVVAMAMLKQHRLWAAEAASAYQQTQPKPTLKLPYNYLAVELDTEADKYSEYHPSNLSPEKSILLSTLEFLEFHQDMDKLISDVMNSESEEDEEEITEEEARSSICFQWREQLKGYLDRLKQLRHYPFKALEAEKQYFLATDEYLVKRRQLRDELRDRNQLSWIAIADADNTLAIAKGVNLYEVGVKLRKLP